MVNVCLNIRSIRPLSYLVQQLASYHLALDDPVSALQYLKEAEELEPENTEVLSSIASAYARMLTYVWVVLFSHTMRLASGLEMSGRASPMLVASPS